ncbi:helix-turn-helix domain-containing protein [Streptomyces sp. NBC_00316]|uniref:helix-turn-helix domain-containing protein n=1 Tax=Streptomyces sp. NBC_00316 TaxID=2975710 RepID=UPI003FA740E4
MEAYLANDRSWAATAQRLNIHRQSLGYRLQRIEAATHRDLKKSRDIAELWVALTARRTLADQQRPAPTAGPAPVEQ